MDGGEPEKMYGKSVFLFRSATSKQRPSRDHPQLCVRVQEHASTSAARGSVSLG